MANELLQFESMASARPRLAACANPDDTSIGDLKAIVEDIVYLGSLSDVPDSEGLHLAISLTHRLGRFIGMRDKGKLVAMAGERMRVPGFAEISGVCTHPEHRGKGYAKALMQIVARAMLERGETPFLHAYAAHEATVALYGTLGFHVRARMHMKVVVPD